MTTQISQEKHTFKLFKKTYMISNQSLLLIVIGVAILLRLMSALIQGNTVTDLPGIYDQISYDGLARRVIEGHGFSFATEHWPATRAGEPTAHWSYLYTLYLAAIYKIFGVYPLIARVIQALIAGIFQTLLIWQISARLFNRTVGLVAAALSAIYIYFFYYAGALITETFYITGILWIIDSALRVVDSDRDTQINWRKWLELGLAIGLTVLLRQVFLIFLPFLFLWVWWNVGGHENRPWKKLLHWSALKGLFLVTTILVLMIMPWTIRNSRVFGTFVLLNTNAGYAFFWGNHPIYGTEFIPILKGDSAYHDLIPKELLPLNEAELDKALLIRGLQFVVDDPTRFFLLSLSRAKEFYKFWPSSDSGLISNISRVCSFGISLPFMLYGLGVAIATTMRSSDVRRRQGIFLLVIFVVVYSGVHLASWALIRYRLPVDAVMVIFAGFAFYDISQRVDSIIKKKA